MSKTSSHSKKRLIPIDYKDLFFGTVSAIAFYIFGIWAIDSGSLWVYALTFTALYGILYFYTAFIRNRFFPGSKPAKAKVSKK